MNLVLFSSLLIINNNRVSLLIAIRHDLADLFGRFYHRLPIPLSAPLLTVTVKINRNL